MGMNRNMSGMSGVHGYLEYRLYWGVCVSVCVCVYIRICQDVMSSFPYYDNYKSSINHGK